MTSRALRAGLAMLAITAASAQASEPENRADVQRGVGETVKQTKRVVAPADRQLPRTLDPNRSGPSVLAGQPSGELHGRDQHNLRDGKQAKIDQDHRGLFLGMSLFEGLSLALGIATTGLLYFTLRANASAARESAKAVNWMARQTRPWLKFENVKLSRVTFSKRDGENQPNVQVQYDIRNVGESPALNVQIWGALWMFHRRVTSFGGPKHFGPVIAPFADNLRSFGYGHGAIFPGEIYKDWPTEQPVDDVISLLPPADATNTLKRLSDAAMDEVFDLVFALGVAYDLGDGSRSVTVSPFIVHRTPDYRLITSKEESARLNLFSRANIAGCEVMREVRAAEIGYASIIT